jgi:HEXXH motif-containing protein
MRQTVSSWSFPIIRARYDSRFIALEAVDPELAREAACLVQEAFVIDTRRFRAGTTVGTLGAIFVSPLGARQDWKRFFEHFVHEAGHSLLFLLMTQAELLTDVEDTTLYESPYRSDKRPLGGVLHAYFVLWRTIYAFDKLLAHPEFRSEEATICTGYNQAGNTGRFMDRFWRTSAELDRSPSFTPFGRALVQSCRDGVSKIQQGGLRI